MSLAHTKQSLHEVRNFLAGHFENTEIPHYKKYLLTSLLSLQLATLLVLVDFPDELSLVPTLVLADVQKIHRRFKHQPSDVKALAHFQRFQNTLLLALTSVIYPAIVIYRVLNAVRSFLIISAAVSMLGALALSFSIPAALFAAGKTLLTRYVAPREAEPLADDLSDAESYQSVTGASPNPKINGFLRRLINETSLLDPHCNSSDSPSCQWGA